MPSGDVSRLGMLAQVLIKSSTKDFDNCMPPLHPRMAREAATVTAMIRLYCRDHHTSQQTTPAAPLCSECQTLHAYASQRLERCPFQEGKTTCAKCPIHCYKPEMRERIRVIMRYAGPRMLLRHPWLSIMHLLVDGARKKPLPSPRKRN